jgi:formylglycine-generating enzyme
VNTKARQSVVQAAGELPGNLSSQRTFVHERRLFPDHTAAPGALGFIPPVQTPQRKDTIIKTMKIEQLRKNTRHHWIVSVVLVFVMIWSAQAATIELELQRSIDLQHWETVSITPGLLTEDGRVRQPAGETNAFFRLRIREQVTSGMALIPAGPFEMGYSFYAGDSDERPVHTVFVSAFYMDRTEVTKALWDDVYQWAIANGYSFEWGAQGKAANHPAHSLTWYDVVKWCNARSEKEGRVPAYYTSAAQTTVYKTGRVDVQNDWVKWNSGYRLPTEAEWEKAARGGLSGRRFPWGDTITHNQANYISYSSYSYDVSSTQGPHPTYATGGLPYTSPVGSFAPNGYGLYDMAGNVSEWCWDWRDFSYYASSPATDPRGPGTGSYRVFRGGGWDDFAFNCRSAFRGYSWPDEWGSNYGYGFRSVLPPGQP